jgi:hypothetical protein
MHSFGNGVQLGNFRLIELCCNSYARWHEIRVREDASKEVKISRAREAGASNTDNNREWADHHVLAQERDLRSYDWQAPDLLKQQQETNLLTTGCYDMDHYTKQHHSFKNEYALEDFEKERTRIQLGWSQKRTSELAK